jgi:hypothetical protein
MKILTHLALASALLFGAGVAQAAPTIFFGENTTAPGFSIAGAPAAARASFLSNLSGGVGSEGFESFTVGSNAPLNIAFPGSTGNITATITGQGEIRDTINDPVGRFNTTPGGSKWWDVSGTFQIDFDAPIAAFGFYGTDIGDFNGQVTVALLGSDGVTTTNLVINNSINTINAAGLFWGFIDTANTYTRITFGNTAAGTDFFGFDDFVIGDAQQIVPVSAPATLALVGLGLLAAGAASRRRRA